MYIVYFITALFRITCEAVSNSHGQFCLTFHKYLVSLYIVSPRYLASLRVILSVMMSHNLCSSLEVGYLFAVYSVIVCCPGHVGLTWLSVALSPVL